jgi:O-antigen/teichoic acid export membrane protein
MFATVAGGALMWAVHFLNKRIPTSEYGILVTLLAFLTIIPSIPLQMVFAQQTAAAHTDEEHRQLSGVVRSVWLGTFLLWLGVVVLVFLLQNQLVAGWQLSNPAALWVALPVVLGCLWLPMFLGILQGQQNFLWLGWAMMLNSAARVGFAAVFVLVLGGFATGILAAVLLGYVVATGITIWHSRGVWSGPSAPFRWRGWLAQVIPLVLGFGACQFLFMADPMFVQRYFDKDQTAFYNAAGTLSRALIWLVGPLTAVMFPKIVRSTARGERSDLMGLTLLCSGALAGCGAVGLTFLGPWLVRFVYQPAYAEITLQLLPWYAWSMLPLSLANVLVNNLLARSEFRVVPWMVLVAAGYGVALTLFHDSFLTVIRMIGLFSTLMMAVAAVFTWVIQPRTRLDQPPATS